MNKTAWITNKEIKKLSKRAEIGLESDYDSSGKNCGGAYACNLINQLRMNGYGHGEIEDIFEVIE